MTPLNCTSIAPILIFLMRSNLKGTWIWQESRNCTHENRYCTMHTLNYYTRSILISIRTAMWKIKIRAKFLYFKPNFKSKYVQISLILKQLPFNNIYKKSFFFNLHQVWKYYWFYFFHFLYCLLFLSQVGTVKMCPQVMKIISFYSLFGTIQSALLAIFIEKDRTAWRLELNFELLVIVLTVKLKFSYIYFEIFDLYILICI